MRGQHAAAGVQSERTVAFASKPRMLVAFSCRSGTPFSTTMSSTVHFSARSSHSPSHLVSGCARAVQRPGFVVARASLRFFDLCWPRAPGWTSASCRTPSSPRRQNVFEVSLLIVVIYSFLSSSDCHVRQHSLPNTRHVHGSARAAHLTPLTQSRITMCEYRVFQSPLEHPVIAKYGLFSLRVF